MNPIEIIVEATNAIAANENDAEAYLRRANALYQTGEKAHALEDYKKAFALNPDLMKQFEGEYKRG